MINRIIGGIVCGILLGGWGMVGTVFAQGEELQELKPIIRSDNSVEQGKNIIFQAERSQEPEGADVVEYLWEFGDAGFSSKGEVVHIFKKPGRYNVKLKMSWRDPEGSQIRVSEITKEIFVFERSLVLITDLEQSLERVAALKKNAEDQNVYLNVIRSAVNLRVKNRVVSLIEHRADEIRNSDTVMIWSDRVDLLTILNSFADQIDFQSKDIVVITDGNISLMKNILHGVLSVLKPNRIILTRKEAVDEFFVHEDERDVVELLQWRGYDLEVLDKASLDEFNFFALPSYGINYLQGKGVEDRVILLVLFLSVIVTLITFLRLVIGFSSVGSRMPMIFTYSFLVLGWKVGLVSVLILALISYLFRRILFRSHLLYMAKVGILISFLGIVLLFIIGGVVYVTVEEFTFSSALMLVLLASMIDRVVGVEGERGVSSIARVFIETLIIAFLGFLLVSWDTLQVLLLSHPEILVLFIMINVFIGRFTGLRLVEYFRFKEVLRYTEE